MAPEGTWQIRELKDCATWYSGGTPSRAVAAYWNGEIPWISAKSLVDFYVGESEECVTEEGARNGTRVVPKNTILFVVRGMSLKSEFRIGLTTRRVAFNQDLKALVAKDGISATFLAYAIRACTEQILGFVGEAGHGTGVLPTDRMQSLAIALPAYELQVQIGRVAQALDFKIALNRRINQTLEAMAQAIFKSWFVDFDPVKAKIAAKAEGRDPLRAAMSAISGKTDAELDALPPEQHAQLATTAALFPDEIEESELGEIPKGWMSSTLGGLCRTYGGLIQTGPFGSQLHAHDYTTEGIPVVMPQDLSGRRICIDKVARVDESDAKRLHRHRLQAGDIVFSRRGDVGRHALVTPREFGWLCGTGCLLVRPSTEAKISAYVSCALAQAESLEWLTRHAVGATMPNLNTTILSNLPIVLPPSAVLTGLQDRLDAMEATKNLFVGETEILAELRDTLLPKLLSGELSLSTREAEAIA
ncbi:MAG: restriction endonuclease subunit S [Burkholderiaceae bacterium]|nr:restriction endonuclease subunit S [Rhodoferax sp.]MCP5285562.1 restriction endonuclease subunit S [Burkholderiaceae bacterium]